MRGTSAKSRDRAHERGHEANLSMIQWNDSAAIAARRMRQGGASRLTIMADGRAIGQIRLEDIERAEKNGNWLGAVMVHHLMRSTEDTCN
jgi:predicted transcriptional regulator